MEILLAPPNKDLFDKKKPKIRNSGKIVEKKMTSKNTTNDDKEGILKLKHAKTLSLKNELWLKERAEKRKRTLGFEKFRLEKNI